MQANVLIALAAFAAAAANDYRDAEGTLELPDCESARAWVAGVSGDAASADENAILYGAQHCAKAGDAAAARRLLALADTIPAASGPYYPHADVQRVRALLELGERDAAAGLMRTTSRKALPRLRSATGDEIWGLSVQSLQTINNTLAMQLRQSQPQLAIEHQLYAADAYEFGGELGLPDMAALYHEVAIEIAHEAKLPDAALEVARRMIALHQRVPDLDKSRAARTSARALLMLVDAGRADEALALARELEATGWPEVSTYVRPFIDRLQRGR